MGCTSSTQYSVDPVTGKETKVTRLGGAHPGNRRPQHQPYVPPLSDFGANGKATAHFVTAPGGGNALILVRKDDNNNKLSHDYYSSSSPTTKKPEYIEVTIPPGVVAGQTIHVQAPDGRLNAVVVPPGFGPGDTFTVEFADAASLSSTTNTTTDSPSKEEEPYYSGYGTATAPPATPSSIGIVHEPEIHYSATGAGTSYYGTANDNNGAYPCALATPVYSAQSAK